MINYLKSEIFRVAKTKSTYIIPLVLILAVLGVLLIVRYAGGENPVFPYKNAWFIFKFFQAVLYFAVFLIPFIVNTLFADEFTIGTFKNSIIYGTDRKVLYFGKLLLMTLYSILTMTIVVLFIIISTNLLMNSGTSQDAEHQRHFINSVFNSIPLFIALLAFAHMLMFAFKKDRAVWVIYFIIIIGLYTFLNYVQYGLNSKIALFLFRLTPYYHLRNIGSYGWAEGINLEWINMSIVFLIYFVGSIVMGLASFRKQDI